MVKKITIGTLLSCWALIAHAQQDTLKRWEIKSGMGLFIEIFDHDILAPKDDGGSVSYAPAGNPREGRKTWYGRSTWAQVAYRLNKRYQLYANYYYNPYKVPYNDQLGLWWKIDEKQAYHSIRAGVNRTFNRDGRFNYKIGLGLVYQREIVERAVYYPYTQADGFRIGIASYAEKFNSPEGGFDFNFDAEYQLSKTAVIGGRFNTYYLYQLGLEGIIISTFIAVKF